MTSVGAGVAVGVVDVAVTTGGRVNTDGRVNDNRVLSVFIEQPVGLHNGDENDVWTVNLDEEGPGVGLSSVRFKDDWSWNFNQQFSGFDVADLKVFLRLENLFADHGLTGEQSVSCRHADALGDTEVFGSLWDDRNFSQDEVLLDLIGFDFVVKVKAFCKRVSDDVASDIDAVWTWCCDERLRC